MLEAIERVSLRHRIARLRGILNGTCNFVLDGCVEGLALADAVQRARDAGFAEADPVEDLSWRTVSGMNLAGPSSEVDVALGDSCSVFQEWPSHPEPDEYWRACNSEPRVRWLRIGGHLRDELTASARVLAESPMRNSSL
jgi:hypothetical protein